MLSKNELIKTLKSTEKGVEALLLAASIPSDLQDYSEHLDRLRAIENAAKRDKLSYADAVTKCSAIASSSPGAVTRIQEVIGNTQLETAIEEEATSRARNLAEAVALGPFEGIEQRASEIDEMASDAQDYGAQVLDSKVFGLLNDPAFINEMVAAARGKRPVST